MNPVLTTLFKRSSQILIDVLVFGFAWVAAYFIRFEGPPPGEYSNQMLFLSAYMIAARILLFYAFSVYSIVWRYLSIRDAFLLVKAAAPWTLLLLTVRYLTPAGIPVLHVPASVIAVEFLLVILGTSGVRMIRRMTAETRTRERISWRNDRNQQVRNVLLIGAGDAGNLVVKELQQGACPGLRVVGFVDDDPNKIGKNIQGVRVLGDTKRIPEIARARSAREAIITIANTASKDIRRIVAICQGAGLKVKIVPGLIEMLDEKITISKVREINVDDLLGRSLFRLADHLPEVESCYKGKRILVTGAGGSIGSELCRQLTAMEPREIVLLDKDENSIFEIDMDLKGANGNGAKAHPVIANINSGDGLKRLFAKYRPQIVFHAAAHKHVPLMELNVPEAVLNNIQGTKNVVETAVEA
ncbi:MAG: polysaccharide biosynthesis protein, partial [Candidatus Aminicenantales bacterium]